MGSLCCTRQGQTCRKLKHCWSMQKLKEEVSLPGRMTQMFACHKPLQPTPLANLVSNSQCHSCWLRCHGRNQTFLFWLFAFQIGRAGRNLCEAFELKTVEASKARPAEVDAKALTQWLRSVRVRMALATQPWASY